MKTCETCEHRNVESGQCNCPKIKEMDFDDDNNEDGAEEAYEAEHKDCLIASGYDEGIFFWTGPNFGCVHHKEK